MPRWIRALLCCVIALAMPLQAFAHDGMRACHERAAPDAVVVEAVHAEHSAVVHVHAAHASHAGPHDHAMQASPGAAHDQGGDEAAMADVGCPLCAACTAAASLPTADILRLPVLTPMHHWASGLVVRVPQITSHGPERPPRAHNA